MVYSFMSSKAELCMPHFLFPQAHSAEELGKCQRHMYPLPTMVMSAIAAGEKDRVEYYRHATHLGPGAEALMGFVEGALRQGQGHHASVLSAACK